MIVEAVQRVKGGLAILAISLVVGGGSLGCVSVQERQARQIRDQTYQVALIQAVQGHVYEMSCEALLPLAADLLWDDGYRVELRGEPVDRVETEARELDGNRRVRYEVHSQEMGERRCAVQFVREEEAGRERVRRRDPGLELLLLDQVDDRAGRRARMEARLAAEAAYEEARRDRDTEPTRW